MTPISVEDEVEIRQPRSRVYAFISDHEHLPAWMAGVSRASRTSPGPVGVGTRYRVVGRMLGRRVESTYELTAYEPDTMFSGRLTSPLFEVEETYRFDGDGSTTKVQLTAEAHPGEKLRLLGPVLALAMPRQVKADHRRLKTLLEARAGKAPAAARPKPQPPPSAEAGAGVEEQAPITEE
ncbi:MAG: SRPBCC family protein [Acidimicrobiales bacterium]